MKTLENITGAFFNPNCITVYGKDPPSVAKVVLLLCLVLSQSDDTQIINMYPSHWLLRCVGNLCFNLLNSIINTLKTTLKDKCKNKNFLHIVPIGGTMSQLHFKKPIHWYHIKSVNKYMYPFESICFTPFLSPMRKMISRIILISIILLYGSYVCRTKPKPHQSSVLVGMYRVCYLDRTPKDTAHKQIIVSTPVFLMWL